MGLIFKLDTEGTDRVAKDRLANGCPIPFQGDTKAFMRRLQLEAWVSFKRFFADKKFHAGGTIPASCIFTQQNFNRAISTPFNEGIDLCYKLLDRRHLIPPVGFDHEMIDWDVYCMLNLLGEVQRCKIPPHLQAGVMVLYFKLCLGHKLPDIPLDITHLIA
jgi:hypothetical protein